MQFKLNSSGISILRIVSEEKNKHELLGSILLREKISVVEVDSACSVSRSGDEDSEWCEHESEIHKYFRTLPEEATESSAASAAVASRWISFGLDRDYGRCDL